MNYHLAMPRETGETARFLNVDLDIYSKSKLESLVAALEKKTSALYVGREGNLWAAHLELGHSRKSADAAIRDLAVLIKVLPAAARKLWDTAVTRDFNIGIQAGSKPRFCQIKLEARTIHAVSALKARIVVTVYAVGTPSRKQPSEP